MSFRPVIEHDKIENGVPVGVNPADIKKYKAPTLVMAAEKGQEMISDFLREWI